MSSGPWRVQYPDAIRGKSAEISARRRPEALRKAEEAMRKAQDKQEIATLQAEFANMAAQLAAIRKLRKR